MTASELRHLAERLCAVEPNDYEDRVITEAAAEVLELVAWAEENKIDVQRGQFFWWSLNVEGGDVGEKTLIGLLRRVKGASDGRA